MKNQMKWIALLTTAVFIYPDILKSQTQWAIDHADSIDFVLQQGDMTDHNVDKEWEVAAAALNTMDNQVPYAFVM